MDKRNRIGAEDILPDLNDLPKYQNIVYQYQLKFRIIYQSETMLLATTYDEDTYADEKQKIEKNDVFLTKESSLTEYEFSINSFAFHVINNRQSTIPKFFGMIAMSDEKHCIAYLYFRDIDLDGIGNMPEFVKTNYHYDW